MMIQASVNHVPKTDSVGISLKVAPSVQCSQFLSLDLLSALPVLKDTLGKATIALSAQITTLETELLAVFAQRDQSHSAAKKFAAVKKDTAGNGRPAKMGPAKHVQLTFTKTESKALAKDVLKKPPPYLSLKTAFVGVDCLGMERAV